MTLINRPAGEFPLKKSPGSFPHSPWSTGKKPPSKTNLEVSGPGAGRASPGARRGTSLGRSWGALARA